MSWKLFLSILLLAAVAQANEINNSELDVVERGQGKEEDVIAFESYGSPVYGPNEPSKSGVIPPKGVPPYGLADQSLFAPINANYAAYLTGIGLANPFGYSFSRYGAMPYNSYGYGPAAYNGLGYGSPYAGNWGYGNPLYNKASAMYSGLGYGLPGFAGYRYGGLGYPAPASLRAPGSLPGPVPGIPGPVPAAAFPGSVPPLALPGAVPAIPGAYPGVPAPYPAVAPAVAPFPAAPVPVAGSLPYKSPATTQAKDGTLKYVSPGVPRVPLY